jgi:ParB-like chromosome segregation protein Spo0J
MDQDRTRPQLPALRAQPRTPELPKSSGAWWGSPTSILAKDADFVHEHARFLRARAEQSNAMGALMDSRVALARALAKLDQLPDIVADDYERGRHEREHQLRLLKLQSATQEVQARTVLLQAEQLLASLQPPVRTTTQAASAPSPGLSPADVQQVVQQLPEISAETASVLTRLLEGLLADRAKP